MASYRVPTLLGTLMLFVLLRASSGDFVGEICHRERKNFFCPVAGTVIHILKATYGNPSSDCSRYSPSRCTSKNVLRELRQYCKDKRVCAFKRLDSFGNPCIGVWESLHVEATCIVKVTQPPTPPPIQTTESSIKKKVICEGMSSFLGCAGGKVINILGAFYGRRSTSYCQNGDTSNTACSTDVTKYARHYNQGKSFGIAQAHSSLFGDPCPGISKYLQINYECVHKSQTTAPPTTTPKPTTVSPFKKKVICEGMSSFLGCAGGKVISILRAFYGRRSTSYCPNGDTSNTACSTDVTKYARHYNQGRTMGIAQAHSSLFGDPCPGISKYLQIEYECVDKDALTTTIAPTASIPPLPSTPVAPPLPPIPGSCGTPQVAQSRIVGGVTAKAGAWPWQIALYRNGVFQCGGALINPMWIVTATHCLQRLNDGDTIADYYVILGDHDRTSNERSEVKRTLSKIVLHPNYDKVHRYNNDIAMMKMSSPVLFTSRISSVCLPDQGQNLPVNTQCFVTGWGMTSYPSNAADVLQQGSMSTVSKQDCANRLATSIGTERLSISDKMLCAGNGPGSPNRELSACRGDSGGPFVCQRADGKWSLEGVVSWGSIRCSGVDRYSVFARVSEFRNWIDYVIKYNGLPPTTQPPTDRTTGQTTEQPTTTAPFTIPFPGPEPPV